MPLTPEQTPEFSPEETSGTSSLLEDTGRPAHRPRKMWQMRLLSVCFAIFTFEIGLFLVVFPWIDAWNVNSFQRVVEFLPDIWESPYLKGAVTGLGFVNIYISFLEVIRLVRRG